jgi:membrane-associated phospholipid phosphatase
MTAAGIDGGLYLDITGFARDTHWLNAIANVYTTVGLGVLGVLVLGAWWLARRTNPAADSRLLAIGAGIGVAIAASAVLKMLFDERRPCLTLPRAYTVVACPGPTDYSFPSNHTVAAAALAMGVYLLHRRLGLVAAALALLEGFTRVYLGMHYPHDVLAGLVVGAGATLVTVLAAEKALRARAAWAARAPRGFEQRVVSTLSDSSVSPRR